MINIRFAIAKDRDRLIEMGQRFAASSGYAQWFKPTREQVAALVDAVIAAESVIVVAMHEGRPIGMIAAVLTEHVLGGKLLDEVVWYVEPEHRGSAGPRMLAHLERWASTKSVTLLKMLAPADSPRVGEFLARRGYAPVESAYVKVLNGRIQRGYKQTDSDHPA